LIASLGVESRLVGPSEEIQERLKCVEIAAAASIISASAWVSRLNMIERSSTNCLHYALAPPVMAEREGCPLGQERSGEVDREPIDP